MGAEVDVVTVAAKVVVPDGFTLVRVLPFFFAGNSLPLLFLSLL